MAETPAEFLKRTAGGGGGATGTTAPETPAAFLARTAPKAGETPSDVTRDPTYQPWNVDVDEWGRTIPDPVPGQGVFKGVNDAAGRVGQAAVEGYRNTPSFWSAPDGTSTRAQVENMDPYGFGRFIVAPAGDIVAGGFGVGAGLFRGAQEAVRQAVNPINPLLARDIAAMPEAFPLGPTHTIGRPTPAAPANPLAGPPMSVMDRMAPAPIEGQTTLGRANALIRHVDQWDNPDAPGYRANNPLDTRVLPPADAPPPPPPNFVPPNTGGPRVGGTPPGVTPHGLTPEQLAEHDKIPESLPPLRKEIVTQADADARADEIIRHFAGVGNKEPLPGVEGSLPAVTQNSGLATLYRAVRDKDTPVQFELAETAVKKAVKDKLDVMSGTEDDLKAAVEHREKTVDPLYKQAWANKGEADPSGAIKTVEDLMNSPLKQNDTAMAELKKIHKKLQGQTDPEQLKGITDSIDAVVQQLNTEGKADRGTRRALAAVDEAITGEIGRVTPGFDAAQKTYADLSRRIDEMKYFQSRKLSDLQGNPTLGNLRSTLDDISRKQAGDKFHPADSVTKENHETLRQLHDQLQREAFTASAGKSLGGSNTFQNLATNTVMGQIGKQVAGNVLGAGGGYLTDLAAGGGGLTGAVIGNITGNVLQGVNTYRAVKAEARQTAGQAMLMKALRERLLNINGKGVESLRGSPPP